MCLNVDGRAWDVANNRAISTLLTISSRIVGNVAHNVAQLNAFTVNYVTYSAWDVSDWSIQLELIELWTI